MRIQFQLAILLLLLNPSRSIAQEEKIDTDRPDQTESAVITPKHWLQLEFGISRQQNDRSSVEYNLPTLLTKYGLGKRIDLRLFTTIAQTNDGTRTTGLVPVELGARVALCEERNFIPKTSLLFHVVIPTLASPAFKAKHLAPNFRFSMQNSLSKTVGLGYNLGAEWDGFSTVPAWIYTLSTGFNLGEKWYAYTELFGEVKKAEPAQHSFDAGIAFFLNGNMKVDLSGGVGISKESPDWYMAAGYSFRFKTGK